jgi:hypothetical protein
MDSGLTSSEAAAYAAHPAGYADEPERGSGWVTFAGVMIFVVGVMNIIYGIAAISNSSFYIADAKFILSDLNTYGWVVLVIGIVQVLVAIGVFARAQFARWTGVAIASVNLIAQLLWISAFPLAGLAFIAIDMLVIYGLVVHGRKPAAP